MSDNHYEVDESLKPARDLMDALRTLANAWDKLKRVRGALIQQKDNDAQGAAVFAQVADRYGYGSTAAAGASFGEIDSAFGTGDAAITQMLDRHL